MPATSVSQPRAPGRARLTAARRELAVQAISCDDEGNALTRADVLAQLIWDQALGYIEKSLDDHGNAIKIPHAPAPWAQTFLYDRIEGKPAPASGEEKADAITATDRVRESFVAITNAAARVAQGPPPRKSRPEPAVVGVTKEDPGPGAGAGCDNRRDGSERSSGN